MFYAPIDVFLNDYNAPQPDLVYVSEAKKGFITNDGIVGAPDLVVKILSPSSRRRDRRKKRTSSKVLPDLSLDIRTLF